MTTIGEINEIPVKANVLSTMCEIEWKIAKFSSFLNEIDKGYESPLFSFIDESWCLKIFPNGHTSNNSIGFISLYVIKKSSGFPTSLDFSLGIKYQDGKKAIEHRRYADIFSDAARGSGSHRCITVSELKEMKSALMQGDILTVFCNLVCPFTVGTSIVKGIKSEYKEASTQTQEEKSDGSLCHDYKRVLLEGSHHDFILRVGDREFRVHRDILKARSPVFWSMLDLDMKEKDSDSVDIPDCHPEAMEQCLLYIYSGKVETLDQSNMLGLYYIADKYDVRGLKEECRDFIKESLSLTNICKVIQLAMNHCDSVLLEKATEYFGDNMLGIMRTVEWQAFMKDNSTVANEILMKCIEKSNNAK